MDFPKITPVVIGIYVSIYLSIDISSQDRAQPTTRSPENRAVRGEQIGTQGTAQSAANGTVQVHSKRNSVQFADPCTGNRVLWGADQHMGTHWSYHFVLQLVFNVNKT